MRRKVFALSMLAAALVASPGARAEKPGYLTALDPIATAPQPTMCAHQKDDPFACYIRDKYRVAENPVPAPGRTRFAFRLYIQPSFSQLRIVQIVFSVTDPVPYGNGQAFPGDAVMEMTVWDANGVHKVQLDILSQWLFEHELNMADLVALPSQRAHKPTCLDPTSFTVEVATTQGYHWAALDCGDAPDPHEAAVYALISQTVLIVRAALPKLGGDFPGP